jgi:hypothetical protein
MTNEVSTKASVKLLLSRQIQIDFSAKSSGPSIVISRIFDMKLTPPFLVGG